MKNKKLYLAGLLVVGLISIPLISSTAFSNAEKGAAPNTKQEAQKKAPKEDVTSYDKWNLVCGQPNKEKQKQCSVTQKITENKKDALAVSFTAGQDKEKKPVMVMRIFTPLGVNLLAKLGFSVDNDKKPMGMPFRSCGAGGCVVVLTVKDEFINKIKNANAINISYQGANSAKPVKIDVPMKGFAKAHEALLKNVTK